MEGIYYQDAQEDSYFEFDSSDDMIVPDSYEADDALMVLSEDEKSKSAEIIEDTYEEDENASLIEDVNGQEEGSRMKVSHRESNAGHSGSEQQLLFRVSDSANRLKKVRKSKPPLDFDLNELPLLDISLSSSPIVKEIRSFDLNQLPPVDDEEGIPEMSKGKVHEDREFEPLNFPTTGRWKITDGVDGRTIILMLRILVPGFH